MGQSSLQVDVDHARLDTISEKARFHGTEEGPLTLTAAALRPVLVGRSNIYISSHLLVMSCCLLLRLSFHNVIVTLLPMVLPPCRNTAHDHPASR
jgi:hypothetical protein